MERLGAAGLVYDDEEDEWEANEEGEDEDEDDLDAGVCVCVLCLYVCMTISWMSGKPVRKGRMRVRMITWKQVCVLCLLSCLVRAGVMQVP